MATDDLIAEFEQSCQTATSVQEKLICGILEQNASCCYLQKYGSPLTLAAFRSQVPIISYEDVGAEIEMIAEGDERPLLCNYPIVGFYASSGTTLGKSKTIPFTMENIAASGKAAGIAYAYRTRSFPSSGRTLGIFYCNDECKTRSGLVVSNASTYGLKSERFREMSGNYTTPYDVLVAGMDWRELTYCHFLCALLQRDQVEQIISIFSYRLCEALRVFESEWEEICSDIRNGSLNETKVTNPKLRQAFFASQPFGGKVGDPAEADAISKICSRESWSGVLPLLFPNLEYVSAVVTGAMQLYIPTLKDYAGENLPIVGLDYFCSEGALGINVNPHSHPENVVYTMVPTSLYFEFLPIDSTCPSDDILGMDQVRVGEQYELIITNFAGLYRYRVGDVIKVESFFHEVPRIAFSYRKKAVLSVHNEMVDEQELQAVVSKVFRDAGIEIANFTSYGNKSVLPPHYTIFIEIRKSEDYSRKEALQRCCTSIDRSFNRNYFEKRIDKVIDSLELVIVKQGTFEKMMVEDVRNGANPGQYKTPRCVSSPTKLELLESGTLGRNKSEEMPLSMLEDWKPAFPKTALTSDDDTSV